MELFCRYVAVADWVWARVSTWAPLAQDTVGKQLIRAADSVGANLVEGDGRHGTADALHFFVIARASARETRYWLERAMARGILEEEEGRSQIAALISATQLLNRLISYRRAHRNAERIGEPLPTYEWTDSDPFAADAFGEP